MTSAIPKAACAPSIAPWNSPAPPKDAHAALDAAVLTAYGFSAKSDLLAQLLALNHSAARRLETGGPVTAPGIPASFPKPETLISGGCHERSPGEPSNSVQI